MIPTLVSLYYSVPPPHTHPQPCFPFSPQLSQRGGGWVDMKALICWPLCSELRCLSACWSCSPARPHSCRCSRPYLSNRTRRVTFVEGLTVDMIKDDRFVKKKKKTEREKPLSIWRSNLTAKCKDALVKAWQFARFVYLWHPRVSTGQRCSLDKGRGKTHDNGAKQKRCTFLHDF